MCAVIIWAVNRAAFTEAFASFAQDRLSVAPQLVDHFSISSRRIRPPAATFTLTRQMCDCSALIGARSEPVGDGEICADAWLGWLHDLPARVPHLARLALMRACSPDEGPLIPVHARGIRASDVTENVLRAVGDDSLLTIDYPAQRS